MSKRLLITLVAAAATLAIILMLGLFHRRLTPEEYDAIQMCAFSDGARRHVESAALANRTVEGAGRGFQGSLEMRSRHQDYRLEVAEDGVIRVQSLSTGVWVRLRPILRQGRVRWESSASREDLAALCRP